MCVSLRISRSVPRHTVSPVLFALVLYPQATTRTPSNHRSRLISAVDAFDVNFGVIQYESKDVFDTKCEYGVIQYESKDVFDTKCEYSLYVQCKPSHLPQRSPSRPGDHWRRLSNTEPALPTCHHVPPRAARSHLLAPGLASQIIRSNAG